MATKREILNECLKIVKKAVYLHESEVTHAGNDRKDIVAHFGCSRKTVRDILIKNNLLSV